MQGPPGGHPPHHPDYGPPPHSAGPPHTPGPYPYFYDDRNQRRKPVRAAQACDSCRQRKAKCDEGRPECQHCKDNHLKCSYREIPPQKSEKQVLAITERLEGLSDNVIQLVENQKSQDEKIQKLLDMQSAMMPHVQTFSHNQGRNESGLGSSNGRPAPVQYKSEDSQILQMHQAQDQSFSTDKQEDEEGEPELKYSMPPKHTTAVHNLMEWPSIRALIPRNQSTTYVMDAESQRGLLRLYGCGEGEDKGDGHEGAASPAGSSSSEGRRMDEETSSSSPHGVWGNGQLPSQPLSTESHSAREHPGGLSPNGGLMLDSQAVDKYFRAYMDNMHILHPFLEPKVLRSMMSTFKRKYSWDVKAPRVTIGAKRKRDMADSPSSLDEFAATNQASRSQPNQYPPNAIIEHSVANAIVLLVLALGKVCDQKEPIPGPANTASIRTSTPHHAPYSDLPLKMAMSTPSSPFGSAMELNGGTPPMAVSSPANPQGKNMDTIPGLAYFAKAADILGELPGGADVSHIQANLLAGLYMGQLARIFPSHYYISVACRACQILIESTEYKDGEKDSDKMTKPRRNLINFAFWSCLQLESDILAEVDLPPSGITRYEGRQHQEMPTGITLDNIPESTGHADILRFYSYQVQLRRTMNDIHSMLYGKKGKAQSKRPTSALLEILNENLENWRKMLGDWDWDDNEYESADINIARMRAKYYGAKYIIHRPSLQYLLRNSLPQTPSIKHSDSPQAQAGSAFPSPVQHSYSPSSRGRRPGEMGPPGRGAESTIERSLLPAAKICIESAVRSTTAFDAVPSRLIITNIFGTAHA